MRKGCLCLAETKILYCIVKGNICGIVMFIFSEYEYFFFKCVWFNNHPTDKHRLKVKATC